MGSSTGWRIAGMEVPLLNTDSVEWRQVSVPSTSSTSTANTSNHPLSKDFASCCAIGDPPSYFIWKTSKNQSNLLEILELCSHKESSRIGLRIMFPDALFPFAFICKDKMNFATGNHLLLYTLTTSGVAYLIKLRNNFDYGTSSLVRTDEILEYMIKMQPDWEAITVVAVATGYLLIGRSVVPMVVSSLAYLTLQLQVFSLNYDMMLVLASCGRYCQKVRQWLSY